MAKKPTYEELEQRIRDLEFERLQTRVDNVSLIKNSEWPEEKNHSQTILEDHLLNIDLSSLINVVEIQSIMDDFSSLTGMATAILDLDGQVIEATGWQDICSKFHRKNPLTCQNCIESDLFLAKNLKAGDFIDYKCKNGLSDVVTALYIGTKHLGNIFTGQFLYDDEDIDEEIFVKQAEKYGFDKKAYLEAFRKIPRYSREKVNHSINFLVKFTTYISKISLSNIQLEQEIEERQKAENAQKESSAMLKALIRAIPDLVWLKDKQGVYLFCNSRFESLYGATENDIVGKTDYDFVEKDLAEFFRKHDKSALESGNPCKNEEEFVFATDGHREIIETIKTPLYNSDGEIAAVLGIGRDITERKRAEVERKKLESQLHQAVKLEALGTLAGGIAHDFNNILSAILGHSQMALDELSPSSPVYEDIQQVMVSGDRAADLVKRILLFSRKEAENFHPLRIQETMMEVVAMFSTSLPSSIKFTKSIDWDCGSIYADPIQIHQVIMNLCTNARQAIKDDYGSISIALSEISLPPSLLSLQDVAQTAQRYACIKIHDSGGGIPAEIQSKIFDPFFTTKTQEKGTGLGLSVVDGIIRKHNGMISLDSDSESGTTFNVYLPIVQQPAVTSLPVEANLSPIGNERILLIDDEEPLNEMNKQVLEKLGYHVTCFSNSLEALKEFQKNPDSFDIIVTDMTMPHLTGLDLVIEALQLRPDTKTILCTGYSKTVNEIKAKSCGVSDYLLKPVLPRVLAEIIREVLDNG